MTLKESQVLLMEHSEVKILLLKLYLERYLSILNNSTYVSEIHLFDLFCGEGIYPNGGTGSPIIMLNTIRAIQEINFKRTQFHCHFNDIDCSKIERIGSFIKEEGIDKDDRIQITLSCDDYRELIPKLKKKFHGFKNQKAFVFIDPYGYKDIVIEDLKQLLETPNAEVLLFLPTQFMFRFSSRGTPESLKNFIDELVPEEMWPMASTGLDFIENLKAAFKDFFSPDRYVDSFIITRDKNQYFCLFFFTSHILGYEKMLDAKWKIDEEEGRGWTNEPMNSLFGSIDKKPNISKFKKHLIAFLQTKERFNYELYHFTLSQGFRPCHAVQTLKNFQSDGKLVIERVDGKPVRKSAYYISYKWYKEEPYKIRIRLK